MSDKPWSRPISVLQPRVWVLQVDLIPTVAFEAMNQREASQMVKEQWLKDDLAALTSEGVPLFKSGQRLSVRPPTPEEITAYREGANARQDDELVLVYLRPLDGADE